MNIWALRQAVLDMMVKQGRISPNSKVLNAYKAQLPTLPQELVLIAIGLMLGDVSLQTNASGTANRIKFEWGDVNKAYAFFVYEQFKMYCLSEPRMQVRINANGNEVTTWCFQTVMHSAFNVLSDLFILDGKKVIKFSLLMEAFGPASLAFWFMDDGGLVSYKPDRYAIQMHTQGFSKEEVESLARLLHEKYGMDCWLKPNKGRWTIAISGHSYDTFFKLVKPYIHSSMQHKLPQGNRTNFDI